MESASVMVICLPTFSVLGEPDSRAPLWILWSEPTSIGSRRTDDLRAWKSFELLCLSFGQRAMFPLLLENLICRNMSYKTQYRYLL